MLQTDCLHELGDGIHHPQANPNLDLAFGQGQKLSPEHCQHGHRCDGETDREEVSWGHLQDHVADQEESRTPDRGETYQEQRRDMARAGRGHQ